MNVYLTDGSFDGLLCAIFASYSHPHPSAIAHRDHYQANIFDAPLTINTDADIVARVLKGIGDVGGPRAIKWCYKTFLSELEDANLLIWRVVRLLMHTRDGDILSNYGNTDILRLRQIVKMMDREIHRMHAFVRFQEAASGRYYAIIEPDFDVLPLLDDHFQHRFADMEWTIFDARRGYGLAFDKNACSFVDNIDEILNAELGQLDERHLADHEKAFQGLWHTYFSSVNIRARKNIKHHERQLPRRYWKYLSEKMTVKPDVPEDFSLRKKPSQ